jgi:hypothetical protein
MHPTPPLMNQSLTCSLLLSSLSLLATTPSQAPATFSFGPKAGLTASTAYCPRYPTSYRTGFETGMVSAVSWGHVSLQAAALYSQKGFQAPLGYDALPAVVMGTAYAAATDLRLDYLTLPVNLAYSPRADGQGWQVVGGPYLGVLLGGHYATTYSIPGQRALVVSGDVAGGDTHLITLPDGKNVDPRFFSRRLDAGFQAGLGYRLGGALLQATYCLGLRNLAAAAQLASGAVVDGNGPGLATYPNNPYYNRAFQLSAAYLFGPKS